MIDKRKAEEIIFISNEIDAIAKISATIQLHCEDSTFKRRLLNKLHGERLNILIDLETFLDNGKDSI